MPDSRLFNEKVAIITGASSGIGKGIAIAFARQGTNLALAARSDDKLEQTAETCKKHGVKVLAIQTDVSREADCKALIDQTVEHFNQIDFLVNNAGISMRALFAEMDLSVMEQTMAINFWGTVYCTRYAISYLLASNGWVIGVSSIAGYRGLPGRTAYSASKFAMNGFLEALRTENLDSGLKVLSLCPGFTTSNIRNAALTASGKQQSESPREEGKMMQPEQVADHMLKAIKKGKKTLVLTRQGKLTVILNKFANALMDKIVFNKMAKEPDAPFGKNKDSS